jgi:casein kinase II subunit beta
MESVQQAKELYGLIHSRFITSGKGLSLIREKYLNGIYGHCPRILCDKQVLIPVGLSEDMKYSRVKVFHYNLNLRFFVPNVKKFTSLGKNAQK